ncbi:MAG: SpoIVB peptidase [Oscillospiraceae bacterium]|nr:SpoIVB peptidase [Oscillospiraceae bacterium]
MRVIRKALFLVLALAALYGGERLAASRLLPDALSVVSGENFSYKQGLLTLRGASGAAAAVSVRTSGTQNETLYLLDVLPLKTVRVTTVQRTYAIPGGMPFGVKMFTEGVVVVGFGDVSTAAGARCPAREAGLELGDVLLTIDGKKVAGNADLASIVAASDGRALSLVYTRGEEKRTAVLTPANAADRTGFKAGMWVRDSSAGIGTLTYIREDTGIAAGLGHGVTDADTGIVLPVGSGELVDVCITGAVRGLPGEPGELRGIFQSESVFAALLYNCEAGIFARVQTKFYENAALPCALRQEIKTGAAKILCTVDSGGPAYYGVEIESVALGSRSQTKNMVLRVTDAALLEKTGGIVQGMSGSPIVQNGMLVGAVTHVFVNDPTRGYGIFIENMLGCEQGIERGENNLDVA